MPSSEQETLARHVADLVGDLPMNVVREVAGRVQAAGEGAGAQRLVEVIDPTVPARLLPLVRTAVQAWEQASPRPTVEALAQAILCAGVADDRRREAGAVEILWSGPSSPRLRMRRTEQTMLSAIEGARKEIWLISYAAYEVAEVRDALVSAARRGVRVNLLLESVDSSGGRVRFDASTALQAVLTAGGQLYEWPLDKRPADARGNRGVLHAKACVVDDDRLLVSSANFTGHAFDLNIELGLMVTGGSRASAVLAHLKWLVDQSVITPIT